MVIFPIQSKDLKLKIFLFLHLLPPTVKILISNHTSIIIHLQLQYPHNDIKITIPTMLVIIFKIHFFCCCFWYSISMYISVKLLCFIYSFEIVFLCEIVLSIHYLVFFVLFFFLLGI